MAASPHPAADEVLTALADAYVRTPGGWPESVHGALAAVLDLLAASPERTRACLVDRACAESPAVDQRARVLERFAELLEPGYRLAERPPPPIAAEAVAGGILELVRGYAIEDRADALGDALPTATVIALTPFVGSDEAERIAARPAPARAGR